MPTRECDLRPGERLRLHRRRLKMSRKQLAAELKLSRYSIGEMEREERDIPEGLITWHEEKDLRAHEKCWVYRTRSDKSQAEVAADLGVSRLWVNKMERGDVCCDTLIWYWEA